jgi:hypothetical protein
MLIMFLLLTIREGAILSFVQWGLGREAERIHLPSDGPSWRCVIRIHYSWTGSTHLPNRSATTSWVSGTKKCKKIRKLPGNFSLNTLQTSIYVSNTISYCNHSISLCKKPRVWVGEPLSETRLRELHKAASLPQARRLWLLTTRGRVNSLAQALPQESVHQSPHTIPVCSLLLPLSGRAACNPSEAWTACWDTFPFRGGDKFRWDRNLLSVTCA